MKKVKRPYITPTISIYSIELECSISAGSAIVKPKNKNEEIFHEWETIEEPTRTIDW